MLKHRTLKPQSHHPTGALVAKPHRSAITAESKILEGDALHAAALKLINSNDRQRQKQGYKLMDKAADHGHAVSQLYIARVYLKKNDKVGQLKGFARIQKAAITGNAAAITNLAACFEEGLGVTRDVKKAVKLYASAAESGYILAQYQLTECLHQELMASAKDMKDADVLTSLETILHWSLRLEAEERFKRNVPDNIASVNLRMRTGVALYELGEFYFRGSYPGCPQNPAKADMVKALDFYTKATEKGVDANVRIKAVNTEISLQSIAAKPEKSKLLGLAAHLKPDMGLDDNDAKRLAVSTLQKEPEKPPTPIFKPLTDAQKKELEEKRKLRAAERLLNMTAAKQVIDGLKQQSEKEKLELETFIENKKKKDAEEAVAATTERNAKLQNRKKRRALKRQAQNTDAAADANTVKEAASDSNDSKEAAPEVAMPTPSSNTVTVSKLAPPPPTSSVKVAKESDLDEHKVARGNSEVFSSVAQVFIALNSQEYLEADAWYQEALTYPLEKAEEAFTLFERSAKRGHMLAQYQLGVMYGFGRGVTRDEKKSAEWLRAAEKQGHAGARAKLAVALDKAKPSVNATVNPLIGDVKSLDKSNPWLHARENLACFNQSSSNNGQKRETIYGNRNNPQTEIRKFLTGQHPLTEFLVFIDAAAIKHLTQMILAVRDEKIFIRASAFLHLLMQVQDANLNKQLKDIDIVITSENPDRVEALLKPMGFIVIGKVPGIRTSLQHPTYKFDVTVKTAKYVENDNLNLTAAFLNIIVEGARNVMFELDDPEGTFKYGIKHHELEILYVKSIAAKGSGYAHLLKYCDKYGEVFTFGPNFQASIFDKNQQALFLNELYILDRASFYHELVDLIQQGYLTHPIGKALIQQFLIILIEQLSYKSQSREQFQTAEFCQERIVIVDELAELLQKNLLIAKAQSGFNGTIWLHQQLKDFFGIKFKEVQLGVLNLDIMLPRTMQVTATTQPQPFQLSTTQQNGLAQIKRQRTQMGGQILQWREAKNWAAIAAHANEVIQQLTNLNLPASITQAETELFGFYHQLLLESNKPSATQSTPTAGLTHAGRHVNYIPTVVMSAHRYPPHPIFAVQVSTVTRNRALLAPQTLPDTSACSSNSEPTRAQLLSKTPLS